MIIPGDSVKEMAIHEVKGRVQPHDKEGGKIQGSIKGALRAVISSKALQAQAEGDDPILV